MRSVKELIRTKADPMDGMSKEECLALRMLEFDFYEQVGVHDKYDDVHGSYPSHHGFPFKLNGRVAVKDVEHPYYLPMWEIEFEDGTIMSAYPEEIFSVEKIKKVQEMLKEYSKNN